MGTTDNREQTPTPKMVLADPEYRYYPLWGVRANDIFCYLCEALWDVGGGDPVPEDALSEVLGDPRRLQALDQETFRKSIEQIEEVTEQYGVLNVLIPVHYQTLAEPETAEAYIKSCNKNVWHVLDYVYYEIVAPPSAPSKGRLENVADMIRPYGSGVMLRVAPGFEGFDAVPAEYFISLGLDLRTDRRDDKDILADLEHFAAETSSRGLNSHVHGLKDVTLTAAAVSAGFDYIGSDTIAPALDTWRPDDDLVKPIDLLKTLLKAKNT